ncbi:MAG: hypothetical protein IKZ43_06185 [Acidaminococcaceae bacterium]|nr:hypothetical protein [Acidaminococcaceae bacterium]
MNKLLKNVTAEKGQGLTEYVLIFAFIAGVAFMMFGGNGSLKGTLVNTVTETNRKLAGLFSDKTDWGHMDVNRDFNSANQAERLAADQLALKNLASFFIGKTETQMRALLTDGIYHTGGQEILLGWFVSTDTGNHFFVKHLKSDGGTYTFANGTERPTNDRVLNWVLGDYGGEDGNYKYSYDSTNNYLVSDYPISQYSNSNLKWNSSATWEPGDKGGNGVKISLTFDKAGGNANKDNWKVTGATVILDSNKQENASAGLTATAP